MGFFNLVETFFFISLAITFVLIMMLVYHFKDRLTSLESKSETILEIINNLLKENTILKSGYLQIIQSIQQTRVPEKQPPSYNKILVSEDDDDDSEDDEDSDEYESEDDSNDNDYEEVNEPEPVIKQIQIHGGFTSEINDIDELEDIETEGLDFEKVSNELDDLEVDIQETDDMNDVGLDEQEINIEEIIVTKLDNIVNEEEDTITTEADENIVQPVEVYRKMEIGELRSIVIQKGLATDTKKMKKMDLIRLLTNTTE